MIDIKLKKDVDENKKISVDCGTCKRRTQHLILTDICLNGNEYLSESDSYDWTNEYQIIQCQGCESIVFRRTHTNSEDYHPGSNGELEYNEMEDVYPSPEEGRLTVDDDHLLPISIKRIYRETLRSLNSNHLILTGIGIRAIIETICKEKESKGKNLFAQINDLVTEGVLTKDGSEILHKLRTLGNQAAHEVKPHEHSQLTLAMDVIDHLIQGVYIIPHHAKLNFG